MTAKIKDLSSFAQNQALDGSDLRIGIVVADWNPEVTAALLNGALSTLKDKGVDQEDIHVHHVPGSFELPQAASLMITGMDLDAVICLGCIIQGETRHFEFIAQAVAQSSMQLGIETDVPVIFGVLTTDTHEQAKERAGGKHGNKGDEAAVAAIRMGRLHREMLPAMDDFFADEEDLYIDDENNWFGEDDDE